MTMWLRTIEGLTVLALAALSSFLLSPAMAETPAQPHDPTEIIVRAIPTGPFPTTVDTKSGLVQEAAESSQASADAQFFGHCVTQKDAADLRAIVDGIPNGNDRKTALDHLIRTRRPCYPNYVAEPPKDVPYYGDCNQRGHFEPVMANRMRARPQ